ncbi:MAG: thiosulfate sulfurtransferase [Caldithrix sp.]|nr:thiosulfate sulfurtransferase [Caldithrix sp.]
MTNLTAETITPTKESTLNQLSTQELLQYLDQSDARIIDVRSPDAYNGWKEYNEFRGGHISGAKSLPAKWAKYIDWIEIVRNKDIAPEHTLILYGYEADQTENIAKLFNRAGYPTVHVYHHFVDEWSRNEMYPMEHLARYRHLVSAKWLNELITTGTAAQCDDNPYVICHAHYRNRSDYEAGHIPGAIDLDTNSLESTETWNRRSPDELKQALQNMGITKDTTVILYGRFSFPDNNDPFPGSSAGHLGAFRCAFIMLYAGVKDVRILNGGLQSWTDAGFEVTRHEIPKHPVADFGAAIPGQPQFAVDLEEARDILKATDKNLVSMRSWREYIGEVSGYNYIEKKGRIPGSVFGDCGSDAYHMENYRNLDHTMREYHEVEAIWAKVGITADKHNAFYCGTGWRGSEAFFNAWLMGWPRVSVFDGGWFEWSNNNLPFETGDPQKQK